MSTSGSSKIEIITRSGGSLAESPVWDERAGDLYWVDISGGSAHRLDAHGGRASWPLGSQVGCIVLRRDGGALVALADGLHGLDLETGELAFIADAERKRQVRFNDGKCDRAGRLWIGTYDDLGEQRAALYRLEPGGRLEPVWEGASGSNGIDWSPDGRTMYWVDSPNRTIFAFDFDVDGGSISEVRPIVTGGRGLPDGITVDSEGCLWCAWWDGWSVTRHRPDGTLILTLDMPVARPTSVAFGGSRLEDLYVTSAAWGLTEDELAAQPEAGAIFAHRPGPTGKSSNRYDG